MEGPNPVPAEATPQGKPGKEPGKKGGKGTRKGSRGRHSWKRGSRTTGWAREHWGKETREATPDWTTVVHWKTRLLPLTLGRPEEEEDPALILLPYFPRHVGHLNAARARIPTSNDRRGEVQPPDPLQH